MQKRILMSFNSYKFKNDYFVFAGIRARPIFSQYTPAVQTRDATKEICSGICLPESSTETGSESQVYESEKFQTDSSQDENK